MIAAELMPLLPELVLVCGAFALLMLDLFLPAGRRVVTHLSSIALLVVVVALIASGVGGHGDVLGGMFVRDTAADVLKISIAGIGALAMVYLGPYLRERGLYQGEVSVLMLFATLGMMLLVSAGSLVMVYVGLEMLALCSYALVVTDRDSPIASEAGIKYFVLGALASGLLLYGLSLVYGSTGTLDLTEISAAAQASGASTMLVTGVAFMVAGIAFKFGAAPFHMWLPDVYHGAPTPITLFIGSAPKLATFGMTYRLLEVGLGPLDDHWRLMLAGLAVLSLAFGNLGALVQTNFKRMLAYSTISHVGFLFLGFAGGGATCCGWRSSESCSRWWARTTTCTWSRSCTSTSPKARCRHPAATGRCASCSGSMRWRCLHWAWRGARSWRGASAPSPAEAKEVQAAGK